jgi:AcrR family transcriptional regulator
MRATLDRGAVREEILDAAERLLARFGYRKMTMDDLAQEVGIGKGTLYLYFPSKEEAVLCTVDRIVARVMVRLEALAAEPGACAGRLRQMLVERVLIRFDAVRRYSESMDELLRAVRPGLLARRRRYFEMEAAVLARVLVEGRRRGELAVEDPPAVGEALVLATNSLLPSSLSTAELGERAQIERRARRIADLLIHGLLAR